MSGQWHLITDLADAGAATLFWVCAAFPVVMSGMWPWWQSAWGKNIVSLEWSIALALLPTICREEFGINTDTYLFGWIVVASLFSAVAIVIWRGVLIFTTQFEETRREARKREAREKKETEACE